MAAGKGGAGGSEPRCLTEDMVFMRTKCNRMDLIRNLNLWGNDLNNISILSQMPNLEVLSLSVNQVSSLAALGGCEKLTELYLRKNNIFDLAEVQHLSSLSKLRVLWLNDNPCAELPYYRQYVLHHLPNLSKLDSQDVTPEERDRALHAAVGEVQTCLRVPLSPPQEDFDDEPPYEPPQRSPPQHSSAPSPMSAWEGQVPRGGGGGQPFADRRNSQEIPISQLMRERRPSADFQQQQQHLQQQQQQQEVLASSEAVLALALAGGGIADASVLDDRNSALANDSSGSSAPTASYGRASRKKYGFGSTMSNIVAPQGTPGYVPGSSRWEGPPKQCEAKEKFSQSPTSPASVASASEVSPAHWHASIALGNAPQSPTSPHQKLRTRSTPAGTSKIEGSRTGSGADSRQATARYDEAASQAMAETLRRQRRTSVPSVSEFRATKQAEEAKQKKRVGDETRKRRYRAEQMEAGVSRAAEDASLAAATGLAHAAAHVETAQPFQ